MTASTSRTGNVADLIRRAAAQHPDNPALISDSARWSWAALDAAVDRAVDGLAASGLRRGDRIVLALPNGRELAAALFGALRHGLIAVPVDAGRSDLATVVGRTSARAVVSAERPDGTRGEAPEIVIEPTATATWWDGDGAAATTPAAAPAADDAPAAPAAGGEDLALLARAARSGPPVMLSHRALLAAAAAISGSPRWRLRATDRVLQLLPMFHVVGLVTALLPTAIAGAAAVLPPAGEEATRVADALEAVQRHRVTVLPGEATLYRQLHRVPGFERALATVRLMTSGSSPLDPEDFAAIRSATGQSVREGYGISEASAAITSTLMVDDARLGSVGRPYPGVEVRIEGGTDRLIDLVDLSAEPSGAPTGDDDDGSDETGDGPVDDIGPIAIRGDTLFSGYWPDGRGGPDADGWFTTGDLGYWDEAGELHLVDRAGETVRVAGFTVYPREVEDVLATHPFVADAAVVGLPSGDGETVVAALVARPGTRLSHADLDEFVAERLPPFKRPTDYLYVDTLPRTEVGRLARRQVRRDFARRRGIDLR